MNQSNDGKKKATSKEKKRSLLISAMTFLFLVVYMNIRMDHKMELLDWSVIGVAVIFTVTTLILFIKEK